MKVEVIRAQELTDLFSTSCSGHFSKPDITEKGNGQISSVDTQVDDFQAIVVDLLTQFPAKLVRKVFAEYIQSGS